MASIFVSHSSRDNGATRALQPWLRGIGYDDVFVDFDKNDGLTPGLDWKAGLGAALSRSPTLLALISDAWFDSVWCQAEYAAAAILGKPVIPVIVERPRDADWQRLQTAVRLRFGDLQYADLTADRAAGMEALERALGRTGVSALAFSVDAGRAPYVGLSAYGEHDAGLFFGREDETRELLEQLRQPDGAEGREAPRLIVIASVSGAGKSSLLRAGLWRQLQLRQAAFLAPPPIGLHSPRPGAALPAEALASTLAATLAAAGTRRSAVELQAMPDAELQSVLAPLRSTAVSGSRLVLCIDQAEALMNHTPVQEAAFLTLLDRIVRLTPATAVMTLRADLLDSAAGRGWFEPLRARVFTLLPMPLARLADIVRGPARRVGAEVEQALVDALVRDARTGDALPLLSLTLERLWQDAGTRGVLRLEDYEPPTADPQAPRPNRLEHSIERVAEQALASVDGATRTLLLDALVPALVNLGDNDLPVRRQAPRSTLPKATWPALQCLVDEARLLVASAGLPGDPVLEVTHEALLRRWPDLKSRIDAAKYDLRLWRDVESAAEQWAAPATGETAELRHNGPRLKRALSLSRLPAWRARLGPTGLRYLQACAQSARRPSRAWAAAAMVLLGLTGGGVWLSGERETARAASVKLAEAAGRAASAGLHDRALRLALLAANAPWWRPADSAASVQLARAASVDLLRAAWPAHAGGVRSIAWSDDGKLLVSVGDDGFARVWDAASGQRNLKGVGKALRQALFVPHSRRFITVGDSIELFDADDPKAHHILLPSDRDAQVRQVIMSSDGSRLLAHIAMPDEALLAWNLTTPSEAAQRLGSARPLFTLALSTTGRYAVFHSHEHGQQHWDLQAAAPSAGSAAAGLPSGNVRFGGEIDCLLKGPVNWSAQALPAERPLEVEPRWVSVSPDCRLRALVGRGGQLILQRSAAASAGLRGVLVGGEMRFAMFSPDARYLVGQRDDGTLRTWDLQTDEALVPAPAHERGIGTFAFRADGKRLATGGLDGSIRIWELGADARRGSVHKHLDVVSAVTFTSDGRHAVSAARTGEARWWAVGNSGLSAPVSLAHGEPIRDAQLSGDDRWLATVGERSTRRWSLPGGAPAGRSIDTGGGPVRLSPDGQRLLVARNGGVELWRAEGTLERALPSAQESVHLEFSRNGRFALAAGTDGVARLWDLERRDAPVTMDAQESLALAHLDEAGRRVLTITRGGRLAVWDARKGTQLHERIDAGRVSRAVFDESGDHVLFAVADEPLRLWTLAGATVVALGDAVSGAVRQLGFAGGGRLALVVNDDKVRLIDVASGMAVVEPLLPGDTVTQAALTVDTRHLLTGEADGKLRLWSLPWVSRVGDRQLPREVCRARPAALTRLTQRDVEVVPTLTGRAEEDVCDGLR